MFKLVDEINDANCITHGAKFHADDVFSTVLMEELIDDMKLIRVLEVSDNVGDKLIYDIGSGKFDHHQKGGNGQRENGIKYAALGLLWKEYGKKYLKKIGANESNIDFAWEVIDKEFIQFVDSIDNGQFNFDVIDIPIVTVSDLIGNYNPNWNEPKDYDAKFIEAVKFAREIWNIYVKKILSKLEAKAFVEDAIENSKENFIVLEQYMPYQDFIINSSNPKAKEILYAVYPSNRGGYGVQAIQKNTQSFENRKPFPESWAGLRDKELQEITGVKSARFCHNARFLCTTDELEDAITLARMAVNA